EEELSYRDRDATSSGGAPWQREGSDVTSGPELGVLLPQSALSRIVRGRSTWEQAEYYVTAARQLGTDVVIFSLSGYDAASDKIRGYAYRGRRWAPWRGVGPIVVHNRCVPLTLGAA